MRRRKDCYGKRRKTVAILITGILFILGMTLKKSKCIYFLQFWWMWALMSFCEDYERYDYYNYVAKYIRSGTEEFKIVNSEFGYTILCRLLNSTGITFDAANAIIVFFILLVIMSTIPKYTEFFTIPSSLYMIYPMFRNGIQIRNAIVSAIVIYSFKFLLRRGVKEDIKYIICVMVAVTIHSAAIIYILLLPAKYLDEKKLRKFTLISGISVIYIMSFMSPILSLLFGEERLRQKMTVKNSIGQMLMMAFWQLSFFAVLMMMRKKRKKTVCINKGVNMYEDMIIKANLILLVIAPLYYVDFSLERIFQNLMVLDYIYFAIFIKEIKIKKAICIETALFLGWFCVATVILEVWHANAWEEIVLAYMNNNAVINDFVAFIPAILLIMLIAYVLALFDINRARIRWRKMRIG